jgi:hypothetical protein
VNIERYYLGGGGAAETERNFSGVAESETE